MGKPVIKGTIEPAENDFVFSDFFIALEGVWKGPISDKDMVDLLYGFVWEPANLLNARNDPVICDPADASKLRKRKANVRTYIAEHCYDEAVERALPANFGKLVIPHLQEDKIDLLIDDLTSALKSSRCSKDFIEKTCNLATSATLTEFLIVCFQTSLTWPNELPRTKKPTKAKPDKDSRQPYDDPRTPDVPVDIDPSELPYVSALMDVYAEEDGVESMTPDELEGNERRKRHFTRQREDYYNAEFVRRCMRDSYTSEADDRFEELENEAYSGIVEVYDRDYANGRARLTNVLDRAVTLDFAKCWVRRSTDWLGNSEKKGLCHVLVNDERIKGWRDADIQ